MSPAMLQILTVITIISICQFGIASLGEDPLKVSFENRTNVNVVNGSKAIHSRCRINRGPHYLNDNEVNIIHENPANLKETTISSNTELVGGSPDFYQVRLEPVLRNPNALVLDFTILTVRYQDDGTFYCYVHPGKDSNSTEIGSAVRYVLVHRPMSSLKLKLGHFNPIEVSSQEPFLVNPGDYEIVCVTEGSYLPVYTVDLSFQGVKVDYHKSPPFYMEGNERKFKTEFYGRLDIMAYDTNQELVCQAKDSTGQSKSVSLKIKTTKYSAVRVDINPPIFNHFLTDEMNVTCNINQSFHSIHKIYGIELGLKGQTPLLSLRQGKPRVDTGFRMTSSMKAQGRIDKNLPKSFLHLTIEDPGSADAGIYTCRIFFYVTGKDDLQENRAYGHATVASDAVTPVLDHVLDQLSILQNIVTDQQSTIADQKYKMKQLQDEAKKREDKVLSRIDKLEVTGKKQSVLLQNVNDTVSYSVAFRARYNSTDKLENYNRLVFTEVDLNVGDAYDKTTGVFTAPRQGFYFLSLVILTESLGDSVDVYLYLEKKALASVYAIAKDERSQTSTSFVLSLNPGDRVWPWVHEYDGTNHLRS